jgi:hypothetical protein
MRTRQNNSKKVIKRERNKEKKEIKKEKKGK